MHSRILLRVCVSYFAIVPPFTPQRLQEPSHETCRVAREQGEQRPMGCVYPRIFAALTPGGSLVGVAAVVVHT